MWSRLLLGIFVCPEKSKYGIALVGSGSRIGDDSFPGIVAAGFPANVEVGLLPWSGIAGLFEFV